MISASDLEIFGNILKWNSSRLETELVIENIKEKEINLSQNVYHIIDDTEEKFSRLFCNNTKDLNLTDICDVINDYDVFEVTVVTVLFLLIVVTVIGNTLIISAVVTTKRLRTVTNCFVTSLAAADLLVGIFVMPPAIAVHISGTYWY